MAYLNNADRNRATGMLQAGESRARMAQRMNLHRSTIQPEYVRNIYKIKTTMFFHGQ